MLAFVTIFSEVIIRFTFLHLIICKQIIINEKYLLFTQIVLLPHFECLSEFTLISVINNMSFHKQLVIHSVAPKPGSSNLRTAGMHLRFNLDLYTKPRFKLDSV